MKKLTKYILIGIAGSLLITSCSKKKPSLVYFPDMYYPVAYDPYQEAVIAYGEQGTTVPLFARQEGAVALAPVPGTIAQNADGILPLDVPTNYNEGYEASKLITSSPLNPANKEKDIARGKDLYVKTCAACHGTTGDGQGNIVQSGAYSGVPNYKDRVITVGSVYYVAQQGRNAMGSYAGQLLPGDMWRVAEYVMNAFKSAASTPVPVQQTQTTEQ
jgi:mono/diheme cytochrome c family protein